MNHEPTRKAAHSAVSIVGVKIEANTFAGPLIVKAHRTE